MRAWIVRLKLQRRSIMRQRRINFPFFEQQIREIAMGVWKIRLQLQRPIIVSDCLISFAFLNESRCQTVIRLGVIGICAEDSS